MPNHVTNELIFRGTDKATQNKLLATICDSNGKVDFQILVPIPLNIWRGNVGQNHEKAFGKNTALDWVRENWGTKWNAYNCTVERSHDTLTVRFDTAWKPPYPWLAAVLNKNQIPFEHNWLSEGVDTGYHGRFWIGPDDLSGFYRWEESAADETVQKHLDELCGRDEE